MGPFQRVVSCCWHCCCCWCVTRRGLNILQAVAASPELASADLAAWPLTP